MSKQPNRPVNRSLDPVCFGCTCTEPVFLSMGILRSLRSWNNRLEPVEFWGIPEKKRNPRADRVRDAAAKGGFQVGQTAKARRGPPCAVTPAEMRTWLPTLFPRSIEATGTTRNRWKSVLTGVRSLMKLCASRKTRAAKITDERPSDDRQTRRPNAGDETLHSFYSSAKLDRNVPFCCCCIVGVRIATKRRYHGMRTVGPDSLLASAPGRILPGLSAHDGIATAPPHQTLLERRPLVLKTYIEPLSSKRLPCDVAAKSLISPP
jgi:hypothetical protein